MTQVVDQTPKEAPADTDLRAAVHRVLAASAEPLTLSKIRVLLPAPFRRQSLEELGEALRRQVAATTLHQYPKYRSSQDRFWDRSMQVHVAALLRQALLEGPLAWSQLRRKLPRYAQAQAEAVLQEQIAQGLLYRHPPVSSRGGERIGAQPPDPKDYLRQELQAAFGRLEQQGFSQPQLREGAMALLQEEEWSPAQTSPPREQPAAASPEASQGQGTHAAASPTSTEGEAGIGRP